MTQDPAFPTSLEDALAQGYEPLPDAELDAAEEKENGALFRVEPAFCQVHGKGTLCQAPYVHASGEITIGYCNGNGQCILYVKKPLR